MSTVDHPRTDELVVASGEPSDETYRRALRRLDPGSRALLDLSLRQRKRPAELAEAMRYDVRTVSEWLTEAQVDVARYVGGDTRIPMDDLRRRLAELPDDAWSSEEPSEPLVDPVSDPEPARRGRGALGRAIPARRRSALGYAAATATIGGLTAVNGVWAAQLVLVVLLFVVPGLLLLRALRVPGPAVAAFPVYVPAASLAVLTFSALAVNGAGPLLGADQPLRTVPMLIGTQAVCLVLLLIGLRAPDAVRVPWSTLGLRVVHLWPMALPALSAAGAARLTSGAGDTVAIVAVAASAGALLVCGLASGRMSKAQIMVALYGIALALIWSFSLRGHFVYGYDIASEFNILDRTAGEGVWHAPKTGDAYRAMLSLTVLPAGLQAITGLSALALLKAVIPALFALFPVALYNLAARFVNARYAFIAAAFVVVQSFFFQQLPAIARQEVALLIFVALVAAALDRGIRRSSQWPFIVVLGATLVVSHYSTTYLAVALFGVMLVLQFLLSRIRRAPAPAGAIAVAFLALIASATVWYGPVTHSTENLSTFSDSIAERGLDVLPGGRKGESAVQTYLFGNTHSQIPAAQYERNAEQTYAKDRRYVEPLPQAGESKYGLKDASLGAPAEKAPGLALRWLHVFVSQIANLLAIAGALMLVFSRRTNPLTRQLAVLGLSTLAVLAFMRLSGTAANAYNQERAFVQTMVALAICMAWLLEWAGRRRRLLGWAIPAVAALALTAVCVSSSGLRSVAFGGGTPTNLADSGEDYERFYVTDQELAAANYIAAVPRQQLVYADRYGQLRILAATGRSTGLFLDVTPKTLDHHAWVYASRTNVQAGRARGEDLGKYAVYGWPSGYLNDYFDTVYDNGQAKAFHR